MPIIKRQGLKKGAVGLSHIVFFVVATAAPLTSVVGTTPPAFAFGNGAGVPGTFLLVGIMYLLFSVGFTAMGKYIGGAGAFYTYISKGISREVGVGSALIILLTYTCLQVAMYALFGLFSTSALQMFGITAPWWLCAYAGIAAVLICGQRDIVFSGGVLGVCMIAEVVILLLLDIGCFVHGVHAHQIGFQSFAPSTIFSHGFGVALVFVVGCYIGFETTAIFREEAKTPEVTVPRATYIAVVIITGFYALSSWAIVQFYGAGQIQSVANANMGTMYFTAAQAVLGNFPAQAMNLLIITSLFACALSYHNTLNRYIFSLSREGLLMQSFGNVHAKHGSPHIAGMVQTASAAVILTLWVLTHADPFAVVFTWMGTLGVIGMIVVEAAVCIAIVRYFRQIKVQENSWTTTITPILALLGLLGALYEIIVNLPILAGGDGLIIRSFPFIIAVTGIVGFAVACWVRRVRPELYDNLGRIVE